MQMLTPFTCTLHKAKDIVLINQYAQLQCDIKKTHLVFQNIN